MELRIVRSNLHFVTNLNHCLDLGNFSAQDIDGVETMKNNWEMREHAR